MQQHTRFAGWYSATPLSSLLAGPGAVSSQSVSGITSKCSSGGWSVSRLHNLAICWVSQVITVYCRKEFTFIERVNIKIHTSMNKLSEHLSSPFHYHSSPTISLPFLLQVYEQIHKVFQQYVECINAWAVQQLGGLRTCPGKVWISGLLKLFLIIFGCIKKECYELCKLLAFCSSLSTLANPML